VESDFAAEQVARRWKQAGPLHGAAIATSKSQAKQSAGFLSQDSASDMCPVSVLSAILDRLGGVSISWSVLLILPAAIRARTKRTLRSDLQCVKITETA
jgi:hypothetical protein